MKVFNSGIGGYTCDNCHTLLWAGHTIRHFIYGLSKEQVVSADEEDGEYYYCCERCRIEDKLLSMVELLDEDIPT